jgi:hypothetical protein
MDLIFVLSSVAFVFFLIGVLFLWKSKIAIYFLMFGMLLFIFKNVLTKEWTTFAISVIMFVLMVMYAWNAKNRIKIWEAKKRSVIKKLEYMKYLEKEVVDEESDSGEYPIRPRDINTFAHFYKFGDAFSELAARCLAYFFHKKGRWISFTKEEINSLFTYNVYLYKLCPENDEENPCNFVIRGKDGRYRITREFIDNCPMSKSRKK